MKTKKTIAIINDPKVTLGSLSDNKIEKKYAWEVNWNSLSEVDQYIILGGHMGAYNIDTYPYLIKEKEWLNNYHKIVFKEIAPFLNNDQRSWLEVSCSPIH